MWTSFHIAFCIFHLCAVESTVIPAGGGPFLLPRAGSRRDNSPHPSLSQPAAPYQTPRRNLTWINSTSSLSTECGPVAQYYRPTAANWTSAGTGAWLDSWWAQNQASFNKDGGFASMFGEMYLGNPDWSCRDDGSADDCAVNPCNQVVLNGAGEDLQPAYYVLESVSNLHSYFQGLSQSLQAAATDAALCNDNWAWTFYKDKNDVNKVDIKEIINIITTGVAVIAAFAAPFASAIKIISAASCASFAGGANAAKYQLQQT
jgi:hypothetical protein